MNEVNNAYAYDAYIFRIIYVWIFNTSGPLNKFQNVKC